MLGAAVASATGALPGLQAREKEAAHESIPTIDKPTGLPAAVAPHVAPPTVLPPGQAKGAPPAASGKTAPPTPTPPAPGPLPGSQVSVSAAEPAAVDDGGSWWSWLVDRLRNFFGSLPTTDPNLSTSAGPRQRLSLEGDADPAHNEHERLAGAQSVGAGRAHADAAISAEFGENAIAPTVPRGKLRPSYRSSPPRATTRARAPAAPGLPAKEREKFDQETAPGVAEQVTEQDSAYQREQAVYKRAAEKAQEDGARQLAEANERARADQLAMREAAKADVGSARQRWRDENRKIEAEFGDKAGAKRRDIDREIAQKVGATHRDADAKLDEAEKSADAEKTKAEAEAAAKKREEEDKPRSWWDRVKGAVSDAFNAIRSAITTIFDKLRQVVKRIIDAAKQAVHALIEAARSAIVGLIRAFGDIVKGLVTIALAAFPEAAAKARAWIDGRVKAATDAVNHAANALEHAADAILDGIAKAIDAALDILQNALLKALDVLEKLALLPLQAMEALAKLVEWVAKNGNFIQAALRLETDADTVIEGLKNSLGGMIAAVPAQAHAKLQEFTASLGDGTRIVAASAPAPATAARTTIVQRAPAPDAATPAKRHVPESQHLAGVLRHLEKGLAYLKDHWWDELKKVGWNLLWPWPAVWGDLKDIWKEVKAGFEDAYHFRVSKVIDHVLAIDQKFNSILGNLYGWFFIASVLVGAILGGIFGVGAGAFPGALAGAAFAGEVGEALVAALIATETAVIVKGVADLAIGNETAAEDEADYDKIGGSTLTIAITLAMMLLGEIAAKLAKSVWEGVAGALRGERAPEVKVEVEPGKPAETPEARGETPAKDTVPEADSQQGVAEERTTADGRKIKILDDGRIFICTTCEELRFKYREEIDASDDFQAKLKDAENTSDPKLKGDRVEALERELGKARQRKFATEDLPTKIAKLDEIAKTSEEVLEKLERRAQENDAILNLRHGQLRGQLRETLNTLKGELEARRADIQTAKDLGDPGIIDELRDQLDDIRAKSQQMEAKLDEALTGEPATGQPEAVPEEPRGQPEVDRSLRVRASRPEARLIENPAERFPRSQALAIDELQVVMNDLYREGAAYGDGSTAYMTMLEQVRGGVGHDPVEIVADTLHAQKAEQYAQGLAEHPQLPNLPPEARVRVDVEISKLRSALDWARRFRAGEDPPVPNWARDWADELRVQ